jgi:hypothetical protein
VDGFVTQGDNNPEVDEWGSHPRGRNGPHPRRLPRRRPGYRWLRSGTDPTGQRRTRTSCSSSSSIADATSRPASG